MIPQSTQSNLTEDLVDIGRYQEGELFIPTEFFIDITLFNEEHTIEKDEGIYLRSMLIQRDYYRNISDYIQIRVSAPMDVYLKKIHPYLENTDIRVTFYSRQTDGKGKFFENVYKVVYIPDNNIIPDMLNPNSHDLSQQPDMFVDLQLMDKSIESIRSLPVNGVYDYKVNGKDLTIGSLIKTFIPATLDKVLIDNKKPYDLFDMDVPDNEDKIKSFISPSGVKLHQFPYYLQNHYGGVYKYGAGFYIQNFTYPENNDLVHKRLVKVYSKLDLSKYDKQEYKTIFYVPMDGTYLNQEKTLSYKDKILKAIVTSDIRSFDNKNSTIFSNGDGVRFANARTMMKKPVKIDEKNQPWFDRGRLNTEFNLKERKDGVFNTDIIDQRVSSNVFKNLSSVIENYTRSFEISWTRSCMDLIYPGSVIKVVYENNASEVIETLATIESAVTIIAPESADYISLKSGTALYYPKTKIKCTTHPLPIKK